MWGLLRIILLIGNAVFLAWLAYRIATIPAPSTRDPQFWLGWGIVICLALNFVYLLLNKDPNWRVFRLIDLWFDAKESELRQRANQSRKDE